MVDPELFARYQQALGTNADLARRAVEDLIAELDGLPPARRAERLLERYPMLVQAYGRVAADVARQYYQESRDRHFEAEGEDEAPGYTAQAAQPLSESWAAEDVRAAAGDGMGKLPVVAVRRVMQRADRTIALNVARDPARGRWAIVPHPGACGWCVMVASNGWAYSERSVNAQRHDGCKCSVAVDFDRDSPSLAGYDPRAMRDAYARAEETVHDDVERRWAAMPADERSRYQRKGRSAHDVFKTRAVAEEMNRRNRDWLQAGAPCHRTKEPGAKPLKKERDVGTALLMHGFDVRFARETPPEKRFDAWLNGESWEFKIPESYGPKTVKNQFKKALGKGTNRLLISATRNNAPVGSLMDDVRALFDNGEFEAITEVLLMSAEGDITRTKRPLPHS